MDFLRRGIQEVSAAANAAVEARRDTAAGGAAGPPGVAGGDAKAIDTVLKGFKDLRAVLQPAAAQASSAPWGQNARTLGERAHTHTWGAQS